MTVRLALDVEARDERSVTVGAAAERLGCDPTTIRELLRRNLLAGVRVGKTARPNGVRVKVWSIEAWERRHAIGGAVGDGDDGSVPAPPKPRRPPVHNPAHEEAMARLKAWGV